MTDTDGAPYWDQDWDAWERIAIAGIVWDQTLVEIRGDAVNNKLDVKQAAGATGATLTPRGSEPRKFTIAITMHTLEHWQGYQALLPYAGATPGKLVGQAVPVVHPLLQAAKIRKVWCDSIGLPQPGPVAGAMTFTIQAIEDLPPVKQASKSKAAAPKTPQQLAKEQADRARREEQLKTLRRMEEEAKQLPYRDRKKAQEAIDAAKKRLGLADPPPSRGKTGTPTA